LIFYPIHYFLLLVSAFSLSNVKDLSLVHVVVDSDLLSLDATELIAFHPATSDKTTFISAADLKAYLDSLSKEYKVLNFKELAVAAPAPAAKAPAKSAKSAKPAAAGNVTTFSAYTV
jgi:prolyl-tRNA synthetase